jgi:hypothetical protein
MAGASGSTGSGAGGGGGAAGEGGALGSGGAGRGGSAGVAGSSGGSGGGSAGTGGSGGSSGSGGGGGRGGSGGSGGSGGRGGSGGSGGGGRGGSGGSAGTGGGGGGGSGGSAGTGGSGGGGSGGSGGSAGSLHVTSSRAFPNFQGSPLLVVVDSQDTAVVVGPSAASDTDDPGPTATWIPRQGSPHSKTFSNAITPSAIAVDPSRNLWMVGQLYRTVNFGGGPLAAVDTGYYLARFDTDGNLAFDRAVTRTGSPYIRGAVADSQGNLYVVGGLMSTTGPSTASVFVTKFSPDGVELYNKEFAGQGTSASAADVAVAASGVFIIGTFNAPVQFGTTNLMPLGSSLDSGFVASLAPDTGAVQWVLRFGGPIFDVGNSVEVTSAGAVRIGGLVSSDGSIGGAGFHATPDGSPFVAELTADGAGTWVRTIPSDGIVFAADTNIGGHTFAGGYVNGTTKQTFIYDVTGSNAMTPLQTTITDDSNGVLFVAADRHGGVWATGDFNGAIDFGVGVLSAADADTFGSFLVHLEP